MNHLDGLVTARLTVDTPKLTLNQMFDTYSGDIEKAMREQLEKLILDGSIAKAAVTELERQLPEYIQGRVKTALWELQIGDVMKEVVARAFANIVREPQP